jgi:hypothetical protein
LKHESVHGRIAKPFHFYLHERGSEEKDKKLKKEG